MPLYLVQDGDRPMYVIAKDWGQAVRDWKTLINIENPTPPQPPLSNEPTLGEMSEPLGIQHVCDDNELIVWGFPPLPMIKDPDDEEFAAPTEEVLRIMRDFEYGAKLTDSEGREITNLQPSEDGKYLLAQFFADNSEWLDVQVDEVKVTDEGRPEPMVGIDRGLLLAELNRGKMLVATVGLPRSGKSTWARATGHPIVCPDEIRLALHGHRYVLEAEPFVWAITKVMVRALFRSGHQVVILDACNTTRKRRDEWQSQEWITRFKAFNTPPSECLKRAEHDLELIPVIEHMAGQFEPLGFDELPLFESGKD